MGGCGCVFGIWLELVNRSTPRRSMSSFFSSYRKRPIMKKPDPALLPAHEVGESGEAQAQEPGY